MRGEWRLVLVFGDSANVRYERDYTSESPYCYIPFWHKLSLNGLNATPLEYYIRGDYYNGGGIWVPSYNKAILDATIYTINSGINVPILNRFNHTSIFVRGIFSYAIPHDFFSSGAPLN